jgi:hypothetical protein
LHHNFDTENYAHSPCSELIEKALCEDEYIRLAFLVLEGICEPVILNLFQDLKLNTVDKFEFSNLKHDFGDWESPLRPIHFIITSKPKLVKLTIGKAKKNQ